MEDTFPLQIQGHELLMDMDVKNIPCEGLRATFANLLQHLPSLSPEVAVTRLRKMIELMEKTTELHSRNACISDASHATVATEDAADLVAAKAAKQCLRSCTLTRCERVREFAFHLVRERLDTGQPLNGLTASLVAKAFEQHEQAALQPAAGETGESREKTELLFSNKYLNLRDIVAAAKEKDISLCPIASERVAYASIEEYLSANGKHHPKTAAKVKAAADWCVEKLQTMADASHQQTKQELLRMWDSSDGLTECGSLNSYFKNGPFSMGKLYGYAARVSGGGLGEPQGRGDPGADKGRKALRGRGRGRGPRRREKIGSDEEEAAAPAERGRRCEIGRYAVVAFKNYDSRWNDCRTTRSACTPARARARLSSRA